jgi:hypothetical protein
MRALRRFLTRLANLTMGRQYEKRLKEEVEVHVALLTEENLRAGLSPIEARRQALLKFGGIEAIKEDYRDQQSLPFLETLLQDTRHALRRLRKTPAFTLTTTLTLALELGRRHRSSRSFMLFCSNRCQYRIRISSTDWGKNPIAVSGADSLGTRSLCWFLMTSTNIFAITHRASRRWPGFRPTALFWGFGAPVAQTQQRAISANSFPAITSACSG